MKYVCPMDASINKANPAATRRMLDLAIGFGGRSSEFNENS